MSIEFKTTQNFDPERCRQSINNETSVFHCHHYTSLFTQLADDAKLLKGPEHLASAAEESMGDVLKKYYKDAAVEAKEDRISIAQQYFAFVGLGNLTIKSLTGSGGSAEMTASHVDEGWLKKWSKKDSAVNYIGQGFIAGAFSAITDNSYSKFKVTETQSIVSGADKSVFDIKLK